MDDLLAVLETLGDKDLAYVDARSKVFSTAEALRNSKINKAWYYDKPQAERERLDEIALAFKREVILRANMVLDDAVVKAAEVKVKGLDSRDERVKQAASTEILDRRIGRPQNTVDVTTKGESLNKGYIGINPDDWDKPDAEK